MMGLGDAEEYLQAMSVLSPPLACRRASLIRNSPPLGSYGRPMPRALWRA